MNVNSRMFVLTEWNPSQSKTLKLKTFLINASWKSGIFLLAMRTTWDGCRRLFSSRDVFRGLRLKYKRQALDWQIFFMKFNKSELYTPNPITVMSMFCIWESYDRSLIWIALRCLRVAPKMLAQYEFDTMTPFLFILPWKLSPWSYYVILLWDSVSLSFIVCCKHCIHNYLFKLLLKGYNLYPKLHCSWFSLL